MRRYRPHRRGDASPGLSTDVPRLDRVRIARRSGVGLLGWGGVAAETTIRQNRRSSQIGSTEGTVRTYNQPC